MPRAGSIPRQDPAPCWKGRMRPVQRRGGRLAARSEQRSRCTVLQITAEACPAICTPSPARVFVLCSAPVPAASLRSPLPPFGTPPACPLCVPIGSGLFQAGQAQKMLPPHTPNTFWDLSMALGLDGDAPAGMRSRGQAAPKRCWRLRRRAVPLHHCASLP